MRKHLFAKTAQDVRRVERSCTTLDEMKLPHPRRDAVAPPSTSRPSLAGTRGTAKPASPMEFP